MGADLRKTRAWLKSLSVEHDSILVGFSGGKDSLCILDLCVPIFRRIEVFSMHFIPGLECFDKPIDVSLKRLGKQHRLAWPDNPPSMYDSGSIRVHRVQHPEGANQLRAGVFRPHIAEALTGDKRLPTLRFNDVFDLVRSKSQINIIVTGERMDESLNRRGQLHGHAGCDYTHEAGPDCKLVHAKGMKQGQVICQGKMDKKTKELQPHESGWWGAFSEKEQRLWPLWDWSTRDVVSYLRGRKIEIPQLGIRGLDLRLETLKWMKENYPDDYDRVIEAFPYAEAQFKREEFLAAREPKDAD